MNTTINNFRILALREGHTRVCDCNDQSDILLINHNVQDITYIHLMHLVIILTSQK
jgi:hypothetical protein